MKNLKILFASSEVTPFAKTGGLADVSGSLPQALETLGHQVVIVMPLYRSVKEGKQNINQVEKSLFVPFRGQNLDTHAYVAKTGKDIPIYFIQREEFFDRSVSTELRRETILIILKGLSFSVEASLNSLNRSDFIRILFTAMTGRPVLSQFI